MLFVPSPGLLVAVDDNNALVRFPTYYATNVNLDPYFDAYLKALAQKCCFGINGNISLVSSPLGMEWYKDPVQNIE